MTDIIRFRSRRSIGNLATRWSVVFFIALLIVVPVYLKGGDWVPLTAIAAVFLLACVFVLGIDYFAAHTVEFEGDRVRFKCGSRAVEYPLGRIEIRKPLWLKTLRGRGLLLRARPATGFVLLVGEERLLEEALTEFENRGVSLTYRNA